MLFTYHYQEKGQFQHGFYTFYRLIGHYRPLNITCLHVTTRACCLSYKKEKYIPSLVQLTLQREQCIMSKAWLGYNNRLVANAAAIAGTPRSRANWIWFSWTSLGATDIVTTFRDSKYAPKLATPQPTSRTTRICRPKVISGIIYNQKNLMSDST